MKEYETVREQAITTLKELDKTKADRLYNDGCDALENQEIDNAIGSFSMAIQEYLRINYKINLAKAYNNLATCFVIKGNHIGTLNIIQEMTKANLKLEHKPEKLLSKAFYNLGLTQKGKEAYESFCKAKEWDQTNVEAIYNLGLELIRQGQYLEAQEEFKKFMNENFAQEKHHLKLNSFCQLIECEAKLDQNHTNTLNSIWQFISDHKQEFFNNKDSEMQKTYNSLIIYMYSRTTKFMLDQGCLIKDIQKFTKGISPLETNPDIQKAVLQFWHDKALSLAYSESANIDNYKGEEILKFLTELSGLDHTDDISQLQHD